MSVMLYSPVDRSKGGRRVFVAIPTYGNVAANTAYGLFNSRKVFDELGIEVELCILKGDCHVDDARNDIVSKFLGSNCTELLFIDADMGWTPSGLKTLLQHDRDVVGASYPKKQESKEDYAIRFLPGEIWSDSDGLIEVEGMPTGFLKIKRHVLEALWDKSKEYQNGADTRKMRLIFERTIAYGGRVGGDINFCRKARAEGFKVYCDPSIYMLHTGEKDWQGTLASFQRRRNDLALTHAIDKLRAGDRSAELVKEMVEDWNNDLWSAGHELLLTLIRVASDKKMEGGGIVIECGSGLSTIAMAAANPKLKVHCIEHEPVWADKLLRAKKRLGLDNITCHFAPIDPTTNWYSDTPAPWSRADMVVIDGPQRQYNSRAMAYEKIDAANAKPRVIIVDDANTEKESFTAWARERQETVMQMGLVKPFLVSLRKAA